MKHLTVYYNPPEDIRVSIDEGSLIFTRQAMEQLLKPLWHSLPDNAPATRKSGPFREGGASYELRDPNTNKRVSGYTDGTRPKIDYNLMREVIIQSILKGRFDGLKECLSDPDIEVKCVKGIRVLEALANVPGETASIDRIKQELKNSLTEGEIRKALEVLEVDEYVVTLPYGDANVAVAKLLDKGRAYLQK